MTTQRKGKQEMLPGIPSLVREKISFPKDDPLKEEIMAFLNAIIENKPPLVTGEDGKQALLIALQITDSIEKNNSIHSIYA